MSSEKVLWVYLRGKLGHRCHVQRHEDWVSAGVPDVSYAVDGVDGWIELKSLQHWPVHQETCVKTGLTLAQAIWLRHRGRSGSGRCFVLLRVGQEHLLFRWDAAYLLTAPVTREELRGAALRRWERGIDANELLAALR